MKDWKTGYVVVEVANGYELRTVSYRRTAQMWIFDLKGLSGNDDVDYALGYSSRCYKRPDCFGETVAAAISGRAAQLSGDAAVHAASLAASLKELDRFETWRRDFDPEEPAEPEDGTP